MLKLVQDSYGVSHHFGFRMTMTIILFSDTSLMWQYISIDTDGRVLTAGVSVTRNALFYDLEVMSSNPGQVNLGCIVLLC